MFPGGEPHFQIEPSNIYKQDITIDARVGTPAHFIMLLAALDAIQHCGPTNTILHLPYFPGARQDRRESGGAFTLQMYAKILNEFSFDDLLVLDPHSDVTAACLSRVGVLSPKPFLNRLQRENGYAGWLSPDAGAEKRIHKLAETARPPRIVYGRKQRDVITGKLSGFSIEALPEAGAYLLVDDICDGGGTFVGLYQELMKDTFFKDSIFDLWITHGLFSKGLEALASCFRTIYTTDSFPRNQRHPSLVVFNLWDNFFKEIR